MWIVGILAHLVVPEHVLKIITKLRKLRKLTEFSGYKIFAATP